MTRIFLIVRSGVVRDALMTALSVPGRFCIVGRSNGVDHPADAVRTSDPDVILVDVPSELGTTLVPALRRASSRGRIYALASSEDDVARRWGDPNAVAWLPADLQLSDLASRIENGAGQPTMRTGPELRVHPTGLTSREREVLTLIDRGLSNREIGAVLEIGISTVKNHVHHILQKLHASRRSQAAAWVAGR